MTRSKVLLTIAAALYGAAIASNAYAASTTGTSKKVAGGAVNVQGCGALNGIHVGFHTSLNLVNDVLLFNIPGDKCPHGTLTVTLRDANNDPLASGSISFSAPTASVPMSPNNVLADTVRHVDVVVVGP